MKRIKEKIKGKKKNIPTALTFVNIILGFAAIIQIYNSNYALASFFVLIAFVFDILDGMLARKLSITSSFGGELDSLADAVSFVVVPGLLIYFNFFEAPWTGLLVSAFVVICGLSRLAKFNTKKATEFFSGMPTPFFAAIVIALVFLEVQLKREVAAILFSLLAILMVSPIKFPSFKMPGTKKFKYCGIALLVLLIIGLALPIDKSYVAIGINVIFWGLIMVPFIFSKIIKKKRYAIFFSIGLLILTLAFYQNAKFLIALPVVYSMIGAPLIQASLEGKLRVRK